MKTIYLLKDNNYFNRTIYSPELLNERLLQADIREIGNFSYGDGINTSLTLNNLDNGNYNYLILNDNSEISQWFILDETYNCKGQYTFSLKRDVIADNYETILNSTTFIKRGYVEPSNILLCNKETNGLNQIKTSEYLLKDETKSPWIVGYIARDSNLGEVEVSNSQDEITQIQGISNYEFYDIDYIDNVDTSRDTIIRINYNIKTSDTAYSTYKNTVRYSTTTMSYIDNVASTSILESNIRVLDRAIDNGKINSLLLISNIDKSELIDLINASNFNNYDKFNNLLNDNGKILHDTITNKYYKVVVNQSRDSIISYSTYNDRLYNLIMSNINTNIASKHNNENNARQTITYSIPVNEITMELVELQGYETSKVTIDLERKHTVDQPYDIFTIPYNRDNNIRFISNGETIEVKPSNIPLNIANGISIKGGNGISDIQILPYCPIREIVNNNYDISNISKDFIYDQNNNKVNVILWCSKSSLSFDIPYTLNLPNTSIDVKLENECNLYRLCAPNYSNYFEFNLARTGTITKFNVDITLKPFNPYIHINPNFSKMYGQDFNDTRGLILSGDYSISSVSDSWANYELQNKNYESIFNRGTQNIELTNKLNNEGFGANIASSIVSDMIQYGTLGGSLGIGFGAGIGAGGGLVSGSIKALGQALDFNNSLKLQQESLDYRKDIQNLTLQNIQALPQTITKTSVLNNNFKYFPIVEFYTCSNEEKEYFKRYLELNSFTLNILGKIKDYIDGSNSTFIQAKLTFINNELDNHTTNEINYELNQGVYFNYKGGVL